MGLSACKSSPQTRFKNITNESAKKQMLQKLVREFSPEQKKRVKHEVKRELDWQYGPLISSLSDDLTIEKG